MALRQAEAGTPVGEICRKLGVSELRELRQLREENRHLALNSTEEAQHENQHRRAAPDQQVQARSPALCHGGNVARVCPLPGAPTGE